jgi:hypothetical protein
MEAEIIDSDVARSSAPIDYDKARHPLTIADAVELSAQLGTPRSKRSVQRFCEQGHLGCVRIKGPRGDQFFINRESSRATPKSCARSKLSHRSATKRAMTRLSTLQRASARQAGGSGYTGATARAGRSGRRAAAEPGEFEIQAAQGVWVGQHNPSDNVLVVRRICSAGPAHRAPSHPPAYVEAPSKRQQRSEHRACNALHGR